MLWSTMEHIIIAIYENGGIVEYPEMMKAFGDDLELAAEWCYNVNLPNRCPMEFTIASYAIPLGVKE